VLLDDGWMRTGDIVVMDDDGFITVVDRIKELIITGGFNVYPSEVEDALRRVPGVVDAAAVGLPDGSGGERVVAAIVVEPGSRLDPEEVRAGAREHLTGYKVPRQVFVVDELPRSLIGKVLHRDGARPVRRLLNHPDRALTAARPRARPCARAPRRAR
jgi:long-chain acyl-CoA synthetase